MVSEAQEGIQEAQTDALRDCAINASVIMVEHFEIGSYRGMINAAQFMGQTEIVDLLNQNLSQEQETANTAEQSVGELLSQVG